MPPQLVEDFFRHEYGRLVAALSRRFGVGCLGHVEDAVQTALMSALASWRATGTPRNPQAWMYRVALNKLLGELRRHKRHRRIREQRGAELCVENEAEILSADRASEDLLRMLFLCAHETIPAESQVVFALKALCGFDIREIALRLFTSEANVYKRFSRAREQLRVHSPDPAAVETALCRSKLAVVQKTIYLIFTEGYLSLHAELAIRRDLCDEALRLGGILAEHPVGRTPATSALLALMHLHAARMSARQTAAGTLCLLEEQDRARWDQDGIRRGLQWLANSAEGACFGRYHAEAAIAAEHCLATSFASTRWDVVADCYAMLERIAPSPVHRLNRAVAVAESQGAAAGLALLGELEPPGWLSASYLWAAVLSDLHRRNGSAEAAGEYRKRALEAAPTPAIRELLRRRLHADDGDSRPGVA